VGAILQEALGFWNSRDFCLGLIREVVEPGDCDFDAGAGLGNFDHKDFRENKVFPCIVKSNIMLLKDLLFRVIFVLIFA
jgi:hypothetical protein